MSLTVTVYAADYTLWRDTPGWIPACILGCRTVGNCAVVLRWAPVFTAALSTWSGWEENGGSPTVHLCILHLVEKTQVAVLVFICFPTVFLQPQFLPPSVVKIPMEGIPSDPQNGIHCVASK